MSVPDKALNALQKELKWVTPKESSNLSDKETSELRKELKWVTKIEDTPDFFDKDTNAVPEELKWVTLKEDSPNLIEKIASKGVFGVLVPLGCASTAGILVTGLYFMAKKNSEKQQMLMRYRVLAQGVTLCLATLGIFSLKTS